MTSRALFLLLCACVAAGCSGEAVFDDVDGAGAPAEPRNTWYVSRLGDGSTGKSWESAWKELAEIDWNALGPGDQVLLDGGEGAMQYESTLRYGKSGKPGKPIVLRMSDEEGRNGQVVIHGGRRSYLPFCGQTDFERPVDDQVRTVGVDTNGHAWVLLDGGDWRGLLIAGHVGSGIRVDESSRHLTFRHVQVFDNGAATWRADGTWYPFGAGVRIAGERVLFDRALIHDNGGDALRSEGGLTRLVLRRTWLYNSRPHPTETDEPFNHCAQSDGVHIASGKDQHGLRIEESIVGPGFQNGLLLSDARVLSEWAVVHDVVLRDTLLLSHHGETATANLSAMQPPGQPPRNWKLERVTSFRAPGARVANVAVRGKGHTVTDSLFVGGEELWFEEPKAERNCHAVDRLNAEVGDAETPAFVKPDYAGVGPGFAAFNFTLTKVSPCQGRGSRITSVAGLMSSDELAPVPAEPPPPPPNELPSVTFLTPDEGTEVPSGQPVAITVTAEDSDGEVTRVDFFAGQELVGTVGAAPYTLTWIPEPGDHLLTVRAFDDDGDWGESAVILSAIGAAKVTLAAADAALGGGFDLAGGCIRQTVNTAVNAGGRAEWTFNVTAPGLYQVSGLVTALSGGENSFFIDFDQEPAATAIWDLGLTNDPQEQLVKWRGAGTEAAPEFSPKIFNLSAGTHTVIVRGREPNACLGHLVIEAL